MRIWYEYHDLPDTKERKNCWVEVFEEQLVTGKIFRSPPAYWSTSKKTGWDSPLEYPGVARKLTIESKGDK